MRLSGSCIYLITVVSLLCGNAESAFCGPSPGDEPAGRLISSLSFAGASSSYLAIINIKDSSVLLLTELKDQGHPRMSGRDSRVSWLCGDSAILYLDKDGKHAGLWTYSTYTGEPHEYVLSKAFRAKGHWVSMWPVDFAVSCGIPSVTVLMWFWAYQTRIGEVGAVNVPRWAESTAREQLARGATRWLSAARFGAEKDSVVVSSWDGPAPGTVDISDDGHYLAIESQGRIRIQDMMDGKVLEPIAQGSTRLRNPNFAPDGRAVAAVGEGNIFLCPIPAFDYFAPLSWIIADAIDVSWSPDSEWIAVIAGGHQGTHHRILLYHLQSRRQILLGNLKLATSGEPLPAASFDGIDWIR